MFKVRLSALDDRVITKRTGVISEEGDLVTAPVNETTDNEYKTILWKEGNVGESPGICINVKNCKKIDESTYEFTDFGGRPFRIEYL